MWKANSILLGVTFVLLTVGVVMLMSASNAAAAALNLDDPYYLLKRQLLYILVAAAATILAARIYFLHWRSGWMYLSGLTVLLLIMTLIPGVGLSVKGASRWLSVGPINFQPSELSKLTVVILLSWYYSRHQRKAQEFIRGLVFPLLMLSVFAGLIFLEPDYGTTILIAAVGMSIMFIAGTRPDYLILAGTSGLSLFMIAIMQNPVRMRRILAFLNPEKYAEKEAFQLLNAISAFVTGGGTGVGLGESIQKKFYLPEAHTDFIFAIIGEELGVTASLGITALFLLFFAAGMVVSFSTKNLFGRLLAFGITMTITLQALINIGVVSGCLPTKGLALPFISYGGSHLLVSGIMLGILLNISRYGPGVHEERKKKKLDHEIWA